MCVLASNSPVFHAACFFSVRKVQPEVPIAFVEILVLAK